MLKEIDYEYNRKALIQEAAVQDGYEPFVDPKSGTVIEQWLIKKKMGEYSRKIANDFKTILNTTVKPRFYIQQKGFTLPWHRDRGTLSAVNFVLSTSKDPIEYRKIANGQEYIEKFEYQNAIIDVQIDHQIRATNGERVLFKLSLPDIDFDTAKNRYDKYYIGNS